MYHGLVRVNSRKEVPEASGRELMRNVRMVTMFLDHQGLSPLGHLIQLLLANTPLGYKNILGGIASSISAAPFSFQGPAGFCHRSGTFSHEFTEPFQVRNR